ncbi:MAG: alpha/beta hydrolase-fold protein [Planctomycetia bacterium]
MTIPPHGHWSRVTVAGHPCEVFAPPEALPGRAVVVLHDLDGAPFSRPGDLRARLESAGLPTIAPLTGRSWWLDRIMPAFDRGMSPERFVRDTIVAEVGTRFGVQPPGIALLGVGMGGQGALRLAYRHPGVFPVAAAIAPALDFHLGMRYAADRDDGECFDTLWESFGDVERARQDTAILHVHPLNWPRHQWFASSPDDLHWHDGASRLHGKLVALGIPHEAQLEALPGENQAAFERRMAAAAVTFVVNSLDKESRRIP